MSPNSSGIIKGEEQKNPGGGINIGAGFGVTGPDISNIVKAKNFGATVKRLIKYLKPQYPMIIVMILLAMIGAWFAIWVPDIMKKVTNALVDSLQFFTNIRPSTDPTNPGNNQLYSYIAPVLLTSGSLYVLNSLFQYHVYPLNQI